jgi:hypothetical protein
MHQTGRAGGIAALVAALTFVVGFVLYATLLADYTTGDPDPAESVAFLADHQTTFYLWNLVIFILFGVAIVVLALALHELLRPVSPTLAPVATAFGLIWAGLVIATGMIANIGIGTVVDLYEEDPARADPVWSALDSVQNGLGGGNEIVGGTWVLLISWAALRAGLFPTVVNHVGRVIGVAGLVTVVPALEGAGAVFGLGLIVWFAWVGVLMLRGSTRSSSARSAPLGLGPRHIPTQRLVPGPRMQRD